jgi:hypothetical protein
MLEYDKEQPWREEEKDLEPKEDTEEYQPRRAVCSKCRFQRFELPL